MEGPTVYENWRASLEGVPVKSTFEYPLFTDARIIGSSTEEYAPYQLINTMVSSHRNVHQPHPSIILRVDVHLAFDPTEIPPMDKTDDENYHGGYIQDEIAALISLSMGIRLKSGDIIRRFSPDDDPK